MLAVAALVAVAILGLQLRLQDPLRTEIIPAEDPYTHMALVNEHLRDGSLDPLYEGAALYPPGMHAFLSAAVAFTGADIYDITRFGPAVIGVAGVLSIAFLVGRYEGIAAGIVASLAAAVAPEMVFRTTMMAPTAFDLVILPVFFYAVLQVVQGRLAWTGVMLPVAAFLLFSHPWVFGVLASTGAVFLGLALIIPWPARRGASLSTLGLAVVVAVLGLGTASLVGGCGAWCGPGFGRLADGLPPAAELKRIIVVATVALVGGLLIASRRHPRIGLSRPWLEDDAVRRSTLRLAMFALVAAVAYMMFTALQRGLPRFVDLPGMFGWPILVLAAVGLAFVPFARSPVSLLGAAIVLATFPFVVFNPLDSPFWPHRTAVYLGIGLMLLAGVAVGKLGRWAVAAIGDHQQKLASRPIGAPLDGRPSPAGVAAAGHRTHVRAGPVTVAIRAADAGPPVRTAPARGADPDGPESARGHRGAGGPLRQAPTRDGRARSGPPHDPRFQDPPARKAPRAATPAAILVAILVATIPAAAVVSATPEPNHWYRLFRECNYGALEEAATMADADPSAVVIMGSWQAKLVVGAHADDVSRTWYHRAFFDNATEREPTLEWLVSSGRPVIVVVDGYTLQAGADTSWLQDPAWQNVGTWSCPNPRNAWADDISIYVHGGSAT